MQVKYASSEHGLDAAIEQLQSIPNKEYVQCVGKLRQQKAKWVLLLHSELMTWGHNMNNFAEASIYILKDVMLHRQKGYNAVALVDPVVEVWEVCFKSRLLDHAHSVPAHEHLYQLPKRMPWNAAKSIEPLGNNLYKAPSLQPDGGKVYEVCQDFRACTCPADQHSAFCNPRGLVHHLCIRRKLS
ncbi:hypothetical protein HPB50_003641 [Hyalomma asiaticum]|uniref:Uncharacterized protein n=1 Tax=Hyalomma asiaticum TaxID=266040 RepID=A0ACB7SDN3_HYAAI|nr:hypothetical protein HPB50_003641 [Hyalomma asiaticum]